MLSALWIVSVAGYQPMRAQGEDLLRPRGRPIAEDELKKTTWEYHPERRPMAVVAELGMNVNSFTQTLQRTFPSGATPNDVLATGSGVSWMFGAGMEYQFRPDWALQARMTVDHKSYRNELDSFVDYRDSTSEMPVDMAVRSRTATSVTYLSIAPSIRKMLHPRVFVSAGLNMQVRLGDLERRDELTVTDANPSLGLPYDYQLRNGLFRSTDRVVAANTDMMLPIDQKFPAKSTEFVPYSSIRTSLELGVGYMHPIDARSIGVIQLRYQYMLSALNPLFMVTDYSRSTTLRLTEITYSDARIHCFQLTVGLWFKLVE